MNKLIPVNFCTDEYSTALSDGVVQWDIGTKLEISGLDVSTDIVEVHFSLSEKSGEAVRMLGQVVDGKIIVAIPKLITEASEQRKPHYNAYAFVYLMNEDSAWTERKIAMVVKSKPRPTDYVSPSELSFLEQLEVALMNKVSIPSFAKVGQVLAVKSVDENGKPIEFEAVNQSGGSGGGGTGADGKDGVGIESVIQTTTSTEDGGINVVTVTKTDGEKSTFEVRNGSTGSKGDKGDKGEQGPVGPKGDTGDKGEQGIQGPKGDTGEQGQKGEQGEQGLDGKDGSDGKTAYQYAQDGGYAGTEKEFAQKLAEDTYSKKEIDAIMGSYVTDIASLIGGIEE